MANVLKRHPSRQPEYLTRTRPRAGPSPELDGEVAEEEDGEADLTGRNEANRARGEDVSLDVEGRKRGSRVGGRTNISRRQAGEREGVPDEDGKAVHENLE